MAIYKLPPKKLIEGKISDNHMVQFDATALTFETEAETYNARGVKGHVLKPVGAEPILVVPKPTSSKAFQNILVAKVDENDSSTLANGRWLRPSTTKASSLTVDELEIKADVVRQSWAGQFNFIEEHIINGETIPGLRAPQIGALYASLAHWKVTQEVGTVVMPTGTGKTETMLALLVKQCPERLLVVAPTDALRTQIAEKFYALGLLRQFGVMGAGAQLPLVGKIEKSFAKISDTRAFLRSCNIIVATMQIISACSDDIQEEMVLWCSHLFIDEAHHVPARTWDIFRSRFMSLGKPVLQFTATPYRNDGKHVGGKTIFNYPLTKAQQEGYFKPINFISLWEYDRNKADRAIASRAMSTLEEDLALGYEHLVMARVDSIEKAKVLHALYEELAPQYSPVLIYSKMKEAERREALKALIRRDSRIVVCVNMLGEGFDLPGLKIAALHEIHKSLTVTIQFIGRFTRTAAHIGNATVIANSAEAKVEEALEHLYATGSDWNVVLRRLSEGETGEQERRSEFIEGFTDPPTNISLYNIRPKMSTVAYRTRQDLWDPDAITTLFKEENLYVKPCLNPEHKVVMFITVRESEVVWGQAKDISDLTYDLFLLHWNPDQRVLYIDSTDNGSVHVELARKVCGDDVQLISGEEAYRPLHGISRAILTNLGLRNSYSRAAQFTMYVGSDLKEGVSKSSLADRVKTNLFARGFLEGQKMSIGCSYKGRVWSHQIADDMSAWMHWAHHVGGKLLDDSISTKEILEHVIIPEKIRQRPAFVPIAIEWSEYFLLRSEDAVFVSVNGHEVPFFEAELQVSQFDVTQPLHFKVVTDQEAADYEISFQGETVEYQAVGAEKATVRASGKMQALSQWFQEEAPIIRFANNAFLIYNLWYVPSQENHRPFDLDKMKVWDWTGTDLTKESKMKAQKNPTALIERPNSIQAKVIENLKNQDRHDILFDDDDSGEAADVVALKVAGDQLIVDFYHCKYSKSEKEGSRVGDLYEVCGQAQKSVFWKGELNRLFEHLKNREAKRNARYEKTRFEKGDLRKLDEVARRARHLEALLRIIIVQPGVSKGSVTQEQLNLMGATELYLNETYSVPLEIIVNT